MTRGPACFGRRKRTVGREKISSATGRYVVPCQLAIVPAGVGQAGVRGEEENLRHHGGALVRGRSVTFAISLTALILGSLLLAVPAGAQRLLYDNGPDGDVGYYHVNFGSAVSNSLVLSAPATLTNITLTLYTVDDSNFPQHLKWTISTEPFGGTVKATGFVGLSILADPYLTQFQFFAWKVGFSVPSVSLPAGTYYLQVQDVVTNWDTWAFWAESGDGASSGYYEAIAQNGSGTVTQVPSESFAVSGNWTRDNAH
jgi:hypothetical protein